MYSKVTRNSVSIFTFYFSLNSDLFYIHMRTTFDLLKYRYGTILIYARYTMYPCINNLVACARMFS